MTYDIFARKMMHVISSFSSYMTHLTIVPRIRGMPVKIHHLQPIQFLTESKKGLICTQKFNSVIWGQRVEDSIYPKTTTVGIVTKHIAC